MTSRLPNRRKRRLGFFRSTTLDPDRPRKWSPVLNPDGIERPRSEPTTGRHHSRGERVGIAMRFGIYGSGDDGLTRVPHTPRLAGINCRRRCRNHDTPVCGGGRCAEHGPPRKTSSTMHLPSISPFAMTALRHQRVTVNHSTSFPTVLCSSHCRVGRRSDPSCELTSSPA